MSLFKHFEPQTIHNNRKRTKTHTPSRNNRTQRYTKRLQSSRSDRYPKTVIDKGPE